MLSPAATKYKGWGHWSANILLSLAEGDPLPNRLR